MKAVAAFLLVLCHLAISHGWTCNEGPRLYNVKQIDAGQGKVVATTTSNYAYFLINTHWYNLGTTARVKHVSVGPAGLWGVDTSNKVHKYVSGKFLPSTGLTMTQVDAGGDGQVAGIYTSSNAAYCLRSATALAYKGTGSLSWTSMSRALTYISCGPLYGCWGVDSSNRLYVMRVTPTTCGVSGWVYVSGIAAKMVEVGTDGSVFVVTTTGKVYQRIGIYSSRPQGSSWRLVSMCMSIKHLSYDLGTLWVVTTSGFTMRCTH
ncbi:fish-egg lectin-like [Scomber japonicus]|uniref:fish-egg lectin-like n=1 Tax=Scomber japonicus TaxID=13676 RepID=UPI00230590C2|nr:fish-egg lectin-like [Scomber japonicus]